MPHSIEELKYSEITPEYKQNTCYIFYQLMSGNCKQSDYF